MKIGIYLKGLNPIWGGAYIFQNEIFNSFIKLGEQSKHTFVIFTFYEPPPTMKLAANMQFFQINLGFINKIRIKLYRATETVFKKLGITFYKFNVDKFYKAIIISSGVDIVWSLSQDCLTTEIPYIVTIWDLQHRLQPYFPEVSADGEWQYREQHYDRILKRASFIITGTEAGKAEIERFYQVPSERIKILPFPTPDFALNSHYDTQKVLEKYNLPDTYLFYPAQFWPHKNHAGALLALKLLRDRDKIHLPVVFVGTDKGNLPYIKKFVIQLDLASQVYFLSFVSQNELVALYKDAFALIFLSFFGPDNLPPLEAFGLGCPVIASNVSGSQEQLSDYAILVDPHDENEVAHAIKTLYEKPEIRKNLVKRGYERARKFTNEDYVKGIFSIIDEFEPIRHSWGKGEFKIKDI